MDGLPKEVMEHILSRCGVESVVRCKVVCKSWESIISNPRFSGIHRLQRSKMWENEKMFIMWGKSIIEGKVAGGDDHVHFMKFKDGKFSTDRESYDDDDLPGTYVVPTCYCNGLFIVRADPDDGNYMLLNPGIRKHTMIRGPTTVKHDAQRTYHFYYDSEVDDYKFVIVVNSESEKEHYYTVYSCKDCSWGEKKDLPNDFPVDAAVSVDGCFYYCGPPGEGEIVYCFDARDEKLDKFRQPEDVVEEGGQVKKYLRDKSGRLCLYSSSKKGNGRIVYQLWVMEKKKSKYCWRKLISTGKDEVRGKFYSPIRLSNNSEDDGVLFWYKSGGRFVGDRNGFMYIYRISDKGFQVIPQFKWSCSTPLYPYSDNLYLPPASNINIQ